MKLRYGLLTLLVLTAVALGGCGGVNSSGTATSAIVVVYVETTSGDTLGVDATVICGGVRGTATNSEASVVLRNVPFGTGTPPTQPLTVSAAGYVSYADALEISDTEVTYATVQMTAADPATTGTITGTITDATTGLPITSALLRFVQVSVGDTTEVRTYTDNKGQYVVGGVPTGSNTVTVEAANYVTTTTSMTVAQDASGGQNPALDVALVGGSTTVDVSGTVYDTFSQEVLSGAQVTIGSLPAVTTDPTGKFTVSGVNVGSQALTATLAGYDDYSAQVDILPGMSPLRVGMVPTASEPPTGPYNLQGIVTLNGLSDNSGATVTAVDPNTSRQWGEVITPASGEYTMFLPPGDYRLTVTYDTHVVRRTVTVPGGGRVLTGINFILTIQ